MTDSTTMKSLVLTYFEGVDTKDFQKIKETLDKDCRITVETHGIELIGYSEIQAMFSNLWGDHLSVLHKDFKFLEDRKLNKIATQFSVVNTLNNGEIVKKSNCNFFRVKENRFKEINIYMAGKNTLFI
tara:strand:- start:268 stop:651 length:384 start_codon:yes stop_codon:yes gene_type:complete